MVSAGTGIGAFCAVWIAPATIGVMIIFFPFVTVRLIFYQELLNEFNVFCKHVLSITRKVADQANSRVRYESQIHEGGGHVVASTSRERMRK